MSIRFAILSFAHYHANFWAQAINAADDAVLVGIWDDVESRGQQAAQQYGTAYYADLDALLASCDAVGITSETARHAELVERAAAAGKHILLEKPMATTVAEGRRIQAAVARAGVTFMQNFPKRYDPINHELVQKVHGGELGKVSMVRVRHGNYHLLQLGDDVHNQWFGDPARSGGGALIDEGIHAIDFLLWLLGMPQQVYAMTSNATLGLPLEDTAVMILSYANGTIAEVAASNTLVAAEQSIEVYGTGGSAILSGVDLASRDFSRPPYLKFHHHGDPREGWHGSDTVPYFRQGNFHQQGPLHFLRCLTEGAAPIATLTEGLQSLMIVEAAYRSARTGAAQRLDFA
jgi:predicted dehydrogenase